MYGIVGQGSRGSCSPCKGTHANQHDKQAVPRQWKESFFLTHCRGAAPPGVVEGNRYARVLSVDLRPVFERLFPYPDVKDVATPKLM